MKTKSIKKVQKANRLPISVLVRMELVPVVKKIVGVILTSS